MTPITFLAAPAYLLSTFPDWTSLVTLRASVPSHVERGITARETRRMLGQTLRLGMRYSTVIQRFELAEFRKSLNEWTTEPILCPLWPAGFVAGASPSVTTSWYVLMGDGLAPAIAAHASLPFARPAFPLLVGVLSNPPDPGLYNDELATADITFEEDSTLSVTPPAFTAPSGPLIAGSARPIWPFLANWSRQPKSGGSELDIDRRDIGFGRERAEAFYDQPARRGVEYSFTLTDSEPWQLLRFFLTSADTANFWLPTGISDARLTANVSSAHTTLTVDRAMPTEGNIGWCLLDDLASRVAVKVTAGSTTTWTLSAAVGANFTASRTRLDSLALARLSRPEISIDFSSGSVAAIRASFEEVPWESGSSGETIGTSIGALPTLAYLYEFTVAYPDGDQKWYLTNFESNLTHSANVYLASQIEHDDIVLEPTLQRHELTIKSRYFSGNPLILLIPHTLEWPLKVKISEADLSSGSVSTVRTLYIGEIEAASFDGPYITARARSITALLDRHLPRRLLQPGCNWALFDTGCGLNRDNWKWQGSVLSWSSGSNELLVNTISRVTGSPVTLTQHWFAGGFIFFGAGNAVQYRSIADNSAHSAGQMTLVLSSSWLNAPAVSTVVYFHPGCDGLSTTCVDKFNNLTRFGGFPFMPIGNPSLVKVSQRASSGGKK